MAVLLRKLLLVLVIVFGRMLHSQIQCIMAVTVLVFSLIAHIWVHPYHKESKLLNKLEMISLVTSAAVFYALFLMEHDALGTKLGNTIESSIAVMNGCVTLYMLSQVIRQIIPPSPRHLEGFTIPSQRREDQGNLINQLGRSGISPKDNLKK